MHEAVQTFVLTFELAFVTTVVLLIVGLPLASWLVATRLRIRPVIETLVSLPLVLPPSVLGFYLLVAFSPGSAVGRFLESAFNLRLVFSFEGLVVGSVIYSLPFMVRPIQSGLEALPRSLSEASYTLGKSSTTTFFRVLIPNIKPSLITGIVLSFAHTVGEFGVVLMIGGNIPGRTRVASIAVYDAVESLRYDDANLYAAILVAITFLILFCVNLVNRKRLRTI